MVPSDSSTNGEDVCPYNRGQVSTNLNQWNKDWQHLDKCRSKSEKLRTIFTLLKCS